MAREIIKISNLLLLGVNIGWDELSAQMQYYIEYYGMMRRNKEENERFKALAEILKKTRGI